MYILPYKKKIHIKENKNFCQLYNQREIYRNEENE